MPNEKEDLKNQLQSIKDNLEKKLSQKEAETKSKIEEKKDSNKEKSKKHLIKKKKPISISTDIEVVSSVKKEKTKEQPKTKTSSKEVKPKLVKKKISHKKKKKPIIPIVLIVLLLLSLFYLYNLKQNLQQDKSNFEKEKKEAIDYSNDVYFKEVEDEVDDEEMQDFAVYKDVPEVVAESNSTSQTLSAKDKKDINAQISQKIKEQDKTAITQNNTTNTQNGTSDTDISSNTITETSTDSKITDNKTNTESKPDKKTEIKKEEVFSDMIKVIALQHKDGSFTMPKKVKKTNAFKIRVRLKKNEISNSDKDTNIMLVIKNAQGSTIKIDSKKVNFGKQNSKVLYLEFYEIFPERLETNTNYSFSVFADKKLIKSYRKSI